jgi:hypothetical protein
VSGGGATRGPVNGLALRDVLASDYAANFRRLGWPVDMRYLQRLAAQDLETVEAHERDDRPSPAPSSEPRPVAPRTTAKDAIEARGMELVEGERPERKSRVLDAPPHVLGARFQACANRIAQILASGADLRATFKRGGFDALIAETEVPQLAREVAELFVHYTALRHRQSKWNPFLGLNPTDAARALIRGLEDIADRSTGALGPWWVR